MTQVQFSVRARSLVMLLAAGVSLAACATPHPRLASRMSSGPPGALPSGAGGRYKVGDPYQVAGVWYVPKEQPNYDQTGIASWYGDEFNMKPTANGEIFDMTALSAAHTTLPLPCIVEVTNLDNGRKLQVRVNDRGPFVGGRLIDLSHAAARELGYDRAGLAHVRVRYVGPAQLGGPDTGLRYAANQARQALPSIPSPSYAPPAVRGPTPAWPSAPPPLTGAALPALPMAPIAVASTALPAIPGAMAAAAPSLAPAAAVSAPVRMAAAAPPPPIPAAQASPVATPASVYRVQAGAFSDEANAQRVASQLGVAGDATVEVVQRNGATLYRVVLQSTSDEGEAWALRDRVAAYGYGDARVLRPF